jgi:hypothetical protein
MVLEMHLARPIDQLEERQIVKRPHLPKREIVPNHAGPT